MNSYLQSRLYYLQKHPYIFRLFQKIKNFDAHATSSPKEDSEQPITMRILSIKYPAKVSKSKSHANLNLSELSAIVEKQLFQAGVGNRPIIFVVHSMGGIILKYILVKQYDKSIPSLSLYSLGLICPPCCILRSEFASIPLLIMEHPSSRMDTNILTPSDPSMRQYLGLFPSHSSGCSTLRIFSRTIEIEFPIPLHELSPPITVYLWRKTCSIETLLLDDCSSRILYY